MICMGCNPSELILYCPWIRSLRENYKDTVIHAQEMARRRPGYFGMEPDSPNNGYGYIQYDRERVVAFKEKPDVQTASEYIQSGNYLWNSGNFMFRAGISFTN